MAKLADASDLGSDGKPYGFESLRLHQHPLACCEGVSLPRSDSPPPLWLTLLPTCTRRRADQMSAIRCSVLASLVLTSPFDCTIVAARRTPQTAPRTSGSCLLLHLTSPLRVAKMQDVHSLLVFRFAAKLSPVHSFLLRAINFAEVLFLWRIRLRRDLNGATEPEPRNTPFLSRRKRRIHTFMNASVRTDRIHIRTTRKKNGAHYRKNTRRSALIFRSKPGSCCRFSCKE